MAVFVLYCCYLVGIAYYLSAISTMAQTSQVPPPRRLKVMCLRLQSEAPFVFDWVAFHSAYGWNTFVVYDDGSRDNLTAVLDELKTKLKVSIVRYDISHWPIQAWKLLGPQGRFKFQNKINSNCLKDYWNISDAILTVDVDEFVFPCRAQWGLAKDKGNPAKLMNIIVDQLNLLSTELDPSMAVTMAIRCLNFGFDNHTTTPFGQNPVTQYFYRPNFELDDENLTLPAISEATKEKCSRFKNHNDTYPICIPGNMKVIYFPRGNKKPVDAFIHSHRPRLDVVRLRSTEVFEGMGRATRQARSRSELLFCCSHYHFRSMHAIRAKYAKNQNLTSTLSSLLAIEGKNLSSPLWDYFRRVKDTDVYEFWSDVLGGRAREAHVGDRHE
jgi:hypothetical protein